MAGFNLVGLFKIWPGFFFVVEQPVIGLPQVVQNYRVLIIEFKGFQVIGKGLFTVSMHNIKKTQGMVGKPTRGIPVGGLQQAHALVQVPGFPAGNSIIHEQLLFARRAEIRCFLRLNQDLFYLIKCALLT